MPTILSPIHDITDHDAYRDGKGFIHIMACELVKRLCEQGHPADAAEWAIHEMVKGGVFLVGGIMESGLRRYEENRLRYLKGAMLKSTAKLWQAEVPVVGSAPQPEAAASNSKATAWRGDGGKGKDHKDYHPTPKTRRLITDFKNGVSQADLAEKYAMGADAVRSAIRRARKAGFLPPAKRGKRDAT